MARNVHGLMQNPDHEYPVRVHLIEHEMSARNQFTRTLLKIGAVRTHKRIRNEAVQGVIDVVEIAVRLRIAPLSVCLDPDIDEIGFCRLGVMDTKHDPRRRGSVPGA